MWDAIAQITISEVVLLFVLLLVLPGMAYMVMQMRKLEARAGLAPPNEKKKKKEEEPPPTPATAVKKVPDNVFPYRTRTFLSPPELACVAAMREVLGANLVEVYPKVALWEMLESTDKDPGYLERLNGLDLDFLVCDKKTGQPLTAVIFNPGKGRPAGRIDLVGKSCAAAGLPAVFIDMAEQYDAKSLKAALGIPDIGS